MFSHREANIISEFVTLHTDNMTSITASHGHYIWVLQGPAKVLQAVRAAEISVGDCLVRLVAPKFGSPVVPACVIEKTEGIDVGLYNPHTASGTVIVNGIAALTFTDTLPPSLITHAVVTLPGRLLYAAFKAVGAQAWCDLLNNALLAAYFHPQAVLQHVLLSCPPRS